MESKRNNFRISFFSSSSFMMSWRRGVGRLVCVPPRLLPKIDMSISLPNFISSTSLKMYYRGLHIRESLCTSHKSHFEDCFLLSLFFGDFPHIFGHISGTTGPIGLKFFVKADFGHPVAHTKFQPLRLKDAEDIGWYS